MESTSRPACFQLCRLNGAGSRCCEAVSRTPWSIYLCRPGIKLRAIRRALPERLHRISLPSWLSSSKRSESRQRFGNSGFGNSCIVARNLVAADLGTRYIQINLGGWDNHTNIYQPNGIYNPARQLDLGLGNLIADLAGMTGSSGQSLLDETLIVVKGEFGRTVSDLNGQQGRDHYAVHS